MRVLIVDDHEILRRGVRSLLVEQTDFIICGEALDGQDAIEKARELKPDLIIMDVSMPRLNGLEATRQIVSADPGCRVVILSQHEVREMAQQALNAGAHGYVVKSSISKDLISAVRKTSAGGFFFDSAILEQKSSTHIDVQEILQRSAAFERALRESEHLYRSTFELTAVGIAHVSVGGRWLRVNKKLCDIVGYSESELLKLTFQDITHPEDLAADLVQTEKVSKGELKTYAMEKRYIRKDGSIVWINLTVSGVWDANGQFKHFISVVEDISARKNAEIAVRESEERLQLAQQVANVGTFDWNIKTGANRWTPELERMYGLPLGGFNGTQAAWERLLHPEDREKAVRAVDRALTDNSGAFEGQWRVTWPDGSVHWLMGRAWVSRDQAGVAERLIGVNVDITEQKRMEQALEESRRQLVLALESSKTAMFDWDVVNSRGNWNPQMAAIYGFQPEREYITAKEWIGLFHPDDTGRLREEAEQFWQHGDEFSFEFRTAPKNGEVKWIISRGRIVRDSEGKAVRMIGIHADITDRKRAEQSLKERQAELKEAQRLATIGSWRWTPDTDTVIWSDELYRIAGRDPNLPAISYKDHHSLYTPESWSRLQTVVNDALNHGTPYTVELEMFRADGEKRWVVANGEAQYDSTGKVSALRGTVQDITDRKRMEEELRRAEERTRFSLEAANIGTWEWNVQTGEVLWSSNMESVHGQAPGSFNRSFDSFLQGVFVEDRERVMQQVKQALSSKGTYQVEYRQYRADGSLGWMEANGRVDFDADGQPRRMFGICANVTERKQAEHEIRRSESRLRAAFSQTYSFLVLLELDGTIIEANRAALEAAGATAEQIVGRKFWEPWWSPLPEEVVRLKEIVAKVANGQSVRDECYFCLPDGSRRVGDRTLSPVFDDHGKVTMIVATGLDITERKETEVTIAVRSRQHKALFHLADELHRASSMEEVHNAALNAILDALQCNRASILLCDEAGVMRFKSWRGLSNEYRAAVDGHSAWRPDEPNPQPVCIDNVETADLNASLKTTVKKEGIAALAFIPLISHGKLIGKFMAYFNAPHEFSDAEIEVGLTIARQLVFAIERTRDDEALSKSRQRITQEAEALKKLNELSSRLWQVRDLQEGLEEMLSATIELVGADKGNVQLLDNERKALTITTQRGFEKPFLDFFREVSADDDTACGRALRTGERIVIEDIEHDAPYAPFREVSRAAGYRSVISTPLIGKGGIPLGILSTHFRDVHRATDQELRRLDLYVRQASAYIDRCKADEVLRQNEQLYKTITDASPIMVWMSGTDKLCYYFNKGWLDFVGRTLEQEYGNDWAENMHPEDFNRCLQVYVSSFDAREPFEMEYRMRHHSGQYRWILDRGVPRYTPDGTFEGYVGGCLDIHDQKEAAEKVRRADEALHLMKVQDQERRHIARELHDTAGQTLTVLGLSLAQLTGKLVRLAPDLLRDGQQAEELVRQIHQEIRTTSYLLHPPLLDENGLSSALKWYVQGLTERGVLDVSVDISESFGRLPADMELALFRIVQECLTNVHRHSGARIATIRVVRDTDVVQLEVRDQGKGIPPERLEEIRLRGSGVGLRGIRERLAQFQGDMKIESHGSGTAVFASIPIPKKESSADLQLVQSAV